MRQLQYAKEFGGTAACTFRLVEETLHCGSNWETRKHNKEENKKELFGGDSWFSSVPVVMGLAERGHEYIGAIKTNHALYPKEEIELLMKNWPSGAYTVWECSPPGKAYKMIAIGYKYNARKVLCFIATENAGSTVYGDPYVARFNDAAGNVCVRYVPRPAVLSKYFSSCNKVDAHNQARQSCLALEKHWVTQDPWFRLASTLFGMTITDCWKAYKFHVPSASWKKKPLTILEFAGRLAYDCIYNKLSTDNGDGNTHHSLLSKTFTVEIGCDVLLEQTQQSVSPLTVATFSSIVAEHPFVDNKEIVEEQSSCYERPRRRRCNNLGCTRLTQKVCNNLKCRLRNYNGNGKIVYGYFYCTEHQVNHWKQLASSGGF